MATKKSISYIVTFSSAENVYDEQQLFKSIFESLYAISGNINDAPHTPTSEEPRKESIA